MKKALPLIITILLIGVAGYGVYLLANKSKDSDTTTPPATTPDTGSCIYDGQTYANNSSFNSTDGCNTCTCTDGEVACTLMACEEEEETLPEEEEETQDEGEDSGPVEYEMAGEGDTAFTLSDLTAEEGDEENTYDVSVVVTTSGDSAEYAQGYTYKWYIAGAMAIENTRESVTSGEKTHMATLSSSRDNPTIKFVVEDPYTSKYVSIEASLEDLL